PAMVAPTTPVETKLLSEPPITFGAPLVPANSSRKARPPLTRSSSGRLSLVPMKFPFVGFAPALPPSFQKLELVKPPRVAALTFVSPAPFPEKLPVKLLAELLNVTALELVPEAIPPAATLPASTA